MLAGAPTGLDLEPHDRDPGVEPRNGGGWGSRPHDVESATPDGVLADNVEPEAFAGGRQETREFTVQLARSLTSEMVAMH